MPVAQVGQTDEPSLGGGDAFLAEPGIRLRLQLAVDTGDGLEVVVRRLLQARARVVVADLGPEQAERREHAGMARHDDRPHREQRRELGAV
jgi:hypothetical protein